MKTLEKRKKLIKDYTKNNDDDFVLLAPIRTSFFPKTKTIFKLGFEAHLDSNNILQKESETKVSSELLVYYPSSIYNSSFKLNPTFRKYGISLVYYQFTMVDRPLNKSTKKLQESEIPAPSLIFTLYNSSKIDLQLKKGFYLGDFYIIRMLEPTIVEEKQLIRKT